MIRGSLLLLLGSCLPLSGSACEPALHAAAQAGPSAAEQQTRTVDPEGLWVWEQAFGGNTIRRELRLKLEDGELTGTLKSIFSNRPNAAPGPISDARINGDRLSFSTVRNFNNNSFKTRYECVIVGDKMGGISSSNFGGQLRESDFTALREPAKRSGEATRPNEPATAVSAQREERWAPQPRIRYELTADSREASAGLRGRLEGPHLFRSGIIENTTRKYWVYVPAQYTEESPACVLVFQDGARAINPNGVLRVPQVLDNLIERGEIPVTIGIFITPGQRGTEYPDRIGTGNPDNRDREYDVLDDKYARFVTEEILPEVGKKYRLTEDPAGRAIGGSSSGAICAFTVAWHKPDAFRNVVSMIGSYTNIHGGHVYPDLVRQEEKRPIRIFLQDGENDLRSPQNLERDWFVQNKKMVAALQERGYDMAHVFGEGGHSDDHGGAMLPDMLRWIWRDYPGVKSQPADAIVAAAKAIKPVRTPLFPGFDNTAAVNPVGNWTWKREGRFASESTLTVKRDGDTLQGVLETRRGNQPPSRMTLERPKLVGNKLLFDVTAQFGERSFRMAYQGIIKGDAITGWQITRFGGNQRDTRWQAKRLPTTP